MKKPEWTVREFARVERVDPRTVRRWLAKGAVPYRKTAGGGVRIPVEQKNEYDSRHPR